MHGKIDGWMVWWVGVDGWMDGWMDRWMDGWMGALDGWMAVLKKDN
jgi:hypothetical protein